MFQRFDNRHIGILEIGILSDKYDINFVKIALLAEGIRVIYEKGTNGVEEETYAFVMAFHLSSTDRPFWVIATEIFNDARLSLVRRYSIIP